MADTKKSSRKKLSYRGENLLQDAGVRLTEDKLERAETKVDKVIADKNLSLSRHQVDALVSFYDNVGATGLRKVVSAIESDRVDEVPALMTEVVANKEGSQTDRVLAEVDLWEGGNAQVLSPKLRMIANGDDEVNAYRALLASSVSSTEQKATQDLGRALVDEADPDVGVATKGGSDVDAAQPLTKHGGPQPTSEVPAKEEDRGLRPATKATVSCFVHLEPGAAGGAGAAASTPDGTIEVHELDIADLEKIRHGRANQVNINGRIAYIETGSPIAPPKPRIGASVDKPPKTRSKQSGKRGAAGGKNDGRPKVIVGVIDVGGFDFAHPDFLADDRGRTSSRFLALWDQGLVDASDHADKDEDIHPWNRELHVPALGEVDDLEELPGLGSASKAKLKTAGVYSQADLALLCDTDLDDLAAKTKLSAEEVREWADEVNRQADSVDVPFGAVFGHRDFDQGLRDAETTGLEATDFVTQTIEQPDEPWAMDSGDTLSGEMTPISCSSLRNRCISFTRACSLSAIHFSQSLRRALIRSLVGPITVMLNAPTRRRDLLALVPSGTTINSSSVSMPSLPLIRPSNSSADRCPVAMSSSFAASSAPSLPVMPKNRPPSNAAEVARDCWASTGSTRSPRAWVTELCHNLEMSGGRFGSRLGCPER
jgi:hypothetical protein